MIDVNKSNYEEKRVVLKFGEAIQPLSLCRANGNGLCGFSLYQTKMP